MSNFDVKDLQSRLISLGYDLGPAGDDGVFGQKTVAAVRSFQADYRVRIQYPGTVGPITLSALQNATASLGPMNLNPDPPWLIEARRYLGLREVAGAKHNPTIIKMLDFLSAPFRNDEEAWCGTYMGYLFGTTLPGEAIPSNPWGSINWLKFGVEIPHAAKGCVGVFWRGKPTGWQGHVGLIVEESADAYRVHGGNQSNAVTESAWLAKSRLRKGGLRWPTTYQLPKTRLRTVSRTGSLSTNEA